MPPIDVENLIEQTESERGSISRRRARQASLVSLAFTVSWAIYVTASAQWGRIGDNWASALTMVFGSFVAGSTPQGGGAVAFPVFTKILKVPSDVARSFSLTIQSAGMTAASIGILVNRRRIDWGTLTIAGPVAIAGFIGGYFVLLQTDTPFGESILPGPNVKIMFTVVVAAMAFVTFLGYRVQLLEQREVIPADNMRVRVLIATCALLGGATSALVGSGADVFIYLAIVTMIGLTPRVGVATSVLVMTLVSLTGMVMLGLFEGHLSTQLDASGMNVATVDQTPVSLVDNKIAFSEAGAQAAAQRFDLFGLWLAAAPVVVWGAPLGSLVASRVSDRQVVKFVITLAAIEVISTLIFLDELRTDLGLAIFGVMSMALAFAGLWLMTRYRHKILGLPALNLSQSVTRTSVDVGPGMEEQLSKPAKNESGD